ncbi:NAD(P)/FAD-dependent oxidoreductase [Undibacter mobilis]|uniref:Pyridine nucleotide-disulfide oxidoreductase n=1 Tax=Undibacter mobilis TaxID=2292256 RepID=A0A371B3I1_9BRAD|nr:FAD-dependent oxidoreductase [Undibacter mobilis]RDV02057.1 pyridine nucleotide-disulfide oxidoreductase [Undibacter mobilis]
MSKPGTVIVGAGQGGYQLAASLREFGYAEPIVLIGEETEQPYQRPPLSKAFLLGEMAAERLAFRSPDFYEKQNIELITGARAMTIDPIARRVELQTGAALGYDHLVLATGARNRALPVPGADSDGVMYLRTLADSHAIRERFERAQDIVVIGAGFIGLELAAVASKVRKTVTVVEALPRVMSRAVTPIVSDFYAGEHRRWGVDLICDAGVGALDASDGKVSKVVLSDGRRIPADLVLVGIGVAPAIELAMQAGVAVDNGIVVDANLSTADPRISAIGDCASFPLGQRYMRLESVQNAVDQARCVARRIVGRSEPYSPVPWFWSDQRDLKLQMVGLTAGAERCVVRGSIEKRAFSVFCFTGETLIGVESVNSGGDHIFGRRLLNAGESISPDEAGDSSFDFRERIARIGKQ